MEEIGSILPVAFKKCVRRGDSSLAEFLAPFWPRVAGKPIAQHSRPVAFEAGTLTLVAQGSSWTRQLRQMAEEIRAEVNSFLREPVVKWLRVESDEAEVRERPIEKPRPRRDNGKSDLGGAGSLASLDLEIARTIERPFTKVPVRNGKRIG